jgi:hypothetical protein
MATLNPGHYQPKVNLFRHETSTGLSLRFRRIATG